MIKSESGFTIIELLVVIAILGILITLVQASFKTVQKQQRDTQRKANLEQYASTLESYANSNNNFYPSRTTTVTIDTICVTLGLSANCPKDPKDGATYRYYYQTNGSGDPAVDAANYVLWAQLESVSSPDTWWVVCSNGKNGQIDNSVSAQIPPTGGACPSGL